MEKKEEVMKKFFDTKPADAEELKKYQRDVLFLNTLLEIRDLLLEK